MLSKVVVLVILIGSACLFLAGIIMVPVGATGVCSRLAITQAGEKQSCFRCTENRCNTCGGSANDVNRTYQLEVVGGEKLQSLPFNFVLAGFGHQTAIS